MRLYVSVCTTDQYSPKRASLEREVPWECTPPDGYVIFLGKEPDGSGSDINAKVKQTSFDTGGITVEAVITNCREEFDDVLQAIILDGFNLKHVFH